MNISSLKSIYKNGFLRSAIKSIRIINAYPCFDEVVKGCTPCSSSVIVENGELHEIEIIRQSCGDLEALPF